MNNLFVIIFRKLIHKILLFVFLFGGVPFLVSGFPAVLAEGENSETYGSSSSDTKKGERLFFGLVYKEEGAPVCASCHNTVEIDTFSWYPSAYEIATKFADRSFEDFKKAVLSPSTPTMKKVHAKAQFSDEDITQIKDYLDKIAVDGLTPKKPTITRTLLFVLLTLIIIIALIDLFFTWKVKHKLVHLVIILLALGGQVKLVSSAAIALGRSQDYAPDQPIKFSHRVHADKNKIDCMYCHTTVEYGKSAGIPSVGVCMNCHILVGEGAESGKYEIDKVKSAWTNKKSIPWIKVHNLPDHVYFNHAQHVGAGNVDCAECHGAVEEMDVIKQVEDLSMGWCIECHRTKEVNFAGNNYYKDYKQLHEDLKAGKIKNVTVNDLGGTDCSKCHY